MDSDVRTIMAEKVTVTDKVKVELPDSSPHRVALELAYEIARLESLAHAKKVPHTRTNPRGYWLELYAQCREVVIGGRCAKYALLRKRDSWADAG